MLRQHLQDFEEVVIVMGVYGGPREFIWSDLVRCTGLLVGGYPPVRTRLI